VYWHPALYEGAMRVLYGARGACERYEVVAALIEPGTEVVDLCAGDGRLRHFLPPDVRYLAVDMNDGFLRRLRRLGVTTVKTDLRRSIPTGDIVVMMTALYHFIPDHVGFVRRAVLAARRRFILTEPMNNVTASRFPFLSSISAWASDPGDGSSARRLDDVALSELLGQVPGGRVVHRARDCVMVWDR
jgi:hypothetical protein